MQGIVAARSPVLDISATLSWRPSHETCGLTSDPRIMLRCGTRGGEDEVLRHVRGGDVCGRVDRRDVMRLKMRHDSLVHV